MSSSTATSIGAARHAEPPQRAPPEPRPHPIDRRRDVPPQPDRIVVAGVERDPRQRRIEVCAPSAHRGRLAVPGRSRDERQRRVMARVERPANPRPIDHAVMDARNRELGLREGDKRVRTLLPRARTFAVIATCKAYIPCIKDPVSSPTRDEDQLRRTSSRMPRFGGEPLPAIRGRSGAAGSSLEERRAAPGDRHLHLNPVACLKRVSARRVADSSPSPACAVHRRSRVAHRRKAFRNRPRLPLGAGRSDRARLFV